MGCDIHFHVEVRRGGTWTHHDWRKPYSLGKDEYGDESHDYQKLFDDPLYVGRNYNLFAILADVRNGVGFAGVDTGDPFVPIADPRGLPDDVTDPVREESERWGRDGHSHSHLTVAELLAYDWDQVTKHRGWVDPWNFELWRRRGKPESWSGGISGAAIEHVSNQQVARMIDSGEIQFEGPEDGNHGFHGRPYTTSLQRGFLSKCDFPAGSVGQKMKTEQQPRHYTQVEWSESYRESVKHFLSDVLPSLQKLGKPEDVRIVFWFDN